MKHAHNAAVYADAFYPRIQAVYAETSFAISTIAECLVESPDFVAFLNQPFVESSRKETMCWTLFGNFINNQTLNLLRLLIDRKSIELLPAIHHELTQRYLQEHAMQEVTISSAVELNQDEQQVLTDVIAALLGKKIYGHFLVDRSLFAGLLIRVGSVVVDTSVKKQLQSLCEHHFKSAFIH